MDRVMSTRHWWGQWCLNMTHLRSHVSFMMPMIHWYKQDFEFWVVLEDALLSLSKPNGWKKPISFEENVNICWTKDGKERKGRKGKGRQGKGREGKGKGREGKGRKGQAGRKEGRKAGRQEGRQGREGRKQASKQTRKEGRKETCLNQQRDSSELKPEGSSVTCSKWWRMSCPTCGISLRCRRCRWCCCDFADFRSYFYGHDELRRPAMSVMSCELLRMWLSSSSPQVSRLCELVDNNGKDIKAATWVTWQISCAEDSGWYIVRVLKDVKTLAYCGMSDIN